MPRKGVKRVELRSHGMSESSSNDSWAKRLKNLMIGDLYTRSTREVLSCIRRAPFLCQTSANGSGSSSQASVGSQSNPNLLYRMRSRELENFGAVSAEWLSPSS